MELAKNPPCEIVEVETVVESVQEPVEASDAEFELVERAVGDFVIAKSFSSFHQKFDLGPKMLSCTPKSMDATNDEFVRVLPELLLLFLLPGSVGLVFLRQRRVRTRNGDKIAFLIALE